MEIQRFARRIGIVVALSAAGVAFGGSSAMAYPLPPPPPTIVEQIPPVPPPEVELPSTGASGLQTSVTLGASAAALGAGLVLVARRRREPSAAVATVG